MYLCKFFSVLVQVPPYLRTVFRYGPFCIFANLTNELHPILIIMSDYCCFLLFVFLWIIACHTLGLSFPVDLENLFIWTLSLCYKYFLQDYLLSFKIYSVQDFWMFMSDFLIYFLHLWVVSYWERLSLFPESWKLSSLWKQLFENRSIWKCVICLSYEIGI